MLVEEKRSVINVNLKKYARQIQHHVTDLKMELLVKIVSDCKLQTIFAKKRHFICVAGFEFASYYNKSMFLANNKRLISPLFGTVALTTYRDFTSSKSTIETLKTLEHHVKCAWS